MKSKKPTFKSRMSKSSDTLGLVMLIVLFIILLCIR